MRFLHTSDWHLGKTLKGRSRSDEQEAALSEILDLARREKIHCILIAGDVFDSHAPPPEAERLAFEFFGELNKAGIEAIVIGGNHDHPKRLAAIRDILGLLNIHIRPEPVRPMDGGIVTLERDGESARIAVLPFVTVGRIEDAAKLMGPEVERYQAYAERIAGMCSLLSGSFSSRTINLLVAHLFVDGAATSRSEREVHITRPYAVSAQRFPATAHYVALGHLHRPQEISAPSRTLYAGSLLQLDFGEQDQEKRVVIIDAHAGKPATVVSCALESGRRLRDVTGTLDELKAQASSFGEDLLRVTVRVDNPVPGVADMVRGVLPNVLEVRLDYPHAELLSPDPSITDPYELFRRFYAQQRKSDPSEGLSKLFEELYEEAVNATD